MVAPAGGCSRRLDCILLLRNVGHGSHRQDFLGEFLIILSTVNLCKGSYFWRNRRMKKIFSASGHKGISFCLD